MAEETSKKTASPTVFMRGGSTTSTWAQQKADDQMRVETAKRRAAADKMKKVAKEQPRNAKLFSYKMGTADSNASIVLSVQGKDSTSQEFETCELNLVDLPSGGNEMTLTLVCPVCAITNNKGHAASQMTLHSSSRAFTLDTRTPSEGGVAGTLWVNPNDSSDVVHLAGQINMHGPARCPVCSWQFIIENNVLRRY
jgi:hypothetical protein